MVVPGSSDGAAALAGRSNQPGKGLALAQEAAARASRMTRRVANAGWPVARSAWLTAQSNSVSYMVRPVRTGTLALVTRVASHDTVATTAAGIALAAVALGLLILPTRGEDGNHDAVAASPGPALVALGNRSNPMPVVTEVATEVVTVDVVMVDDVVVADEDAEALEALSPDDRRAATERALDAIWGQDWPSAILELDAVRAELHESDEDASVPQGEALLAGTPSDVVPEPPMRIDALPPDPTETEHASPVVVAASVPDSPGGEESRVDEDESYWVALREAESDAYAEVDDTLAFDSDERVRIPAWCRRLTFGMPGFVRSPVGPPDRVADQTSSFIEETFAC
jgi:hypothetical protein